jgi:hypothetical protein
MALARIIAPQGLMNMDLKSRAVKDVARVLKAALGVSREEDDTGISWASSTGVIFAAGHLRTQSIETPTGV